MPDEEKAMRRELMKDYIPSNSRPVECVETGEVFETIKRAARAYNVYSANITKVCNGALKTTGGYHWRYVSSQIN